jgi:hypothetical protein
MKYNITSLLSLFTFVSLISCLPPSQPYPYMEPEQVVAEAEAWSQTLEEYIQGWAQGINPSQIPDELIPEGIEDSQNFYLKHPDEVTPEETWAIRYAKPINKDSLYAGIPDPRITYLFLGTALAPFGSKLIIEGEFPHCRFFSIQASPPLNGKEYYSQRQFGTAEVSTVDADIQPLPGHINPFLPGADRTAENRSYRLTYDLVTGDPTTLNDPAHSHPYRHNDNNRKAAMLVYQGPLGHQTIAGTPLPVPGDWNLGCVWIRYYAPDDDVDALGGVPLPKAYFELPDGTPYFIGSDFSTLQARADATFPNRVTEPANVSDDDPKNGWFKSWGITRSILNGVCMANNWSRPDSSVRVNEIELGWTGRGENQPPPGNIEPHATTNNYASYLGRTITVPPGMVAVLTGRMPTFPSTRNSEAIMETGQVRYWSICGVDQDPLSPSPATTIHAITDDEVTLDEQRNYVIAYSRENERPNNATADNGVSWVDWGTQSSMGVLMRWVCVTPEWNFPLNPHENNLSWATSDWSGSAYDSTLIGLNYRRGFMQCYLPMVHLMTVEEFENLGNNLRAEDIPVWVNEDYTSIGPSDASFGSASASSFLDNTAVNSAINAIDSDITTAWSSQWGQSVASITVDLGETKNISAIKLIWDFIFFGRDYSIQISNDNATWEDIAVMNDSDGLSDVFKNLNGNFGRYVRLLCTQPNTSYYRLVEFEVYTSDCDCEDVFSNVNEVLETPSFRLYPNPATDYIQLHIDLAGEKDIIIYNLNGQIIQQFKSSEKRIQIDTEALRAGTYIAVVKNKNRTLTKKFIIQN